MILPKRCKLKKSITIESKKLADLMAVFQSRGLFRKVKQEKMHQKPCGRIAIRSEMTEMTEMVMNGLKRVKQRTDW